MYESEETKKLSKKRKTNYAFLPIIILPFIAFCIFLGDWIIRNTVGGNEMSKILCLVFGVFFVIALVIWAPICSLTDKKLKAAREVDKQLNIKQEEAELEVELELKKEKMKKEFWEKENSQKQASILRCTYCSAKLEQTDKVCSQCGRTV